MYKYLLILSVLLIQQCEEKDILQNRAFYYWKSSYNFSQQEKKLVNELNVNKFYIRFFDVDWSTIRNEAVPVGKLRLNYGEFYPENFVPCIYITNTVMLKSAKKQLDTLVNRIKKKISEITTNMDYHDFGKDEHSQPKNHGNWLEVQIDCDWTVSSKENYFYFLNKLKEAFAQKQISITLRLWQLKYQQKAGIPPADKVMLMCYSTGNPKEYNIENSLATFKDISKYIKGQSYDLPLDIALPIYNWAVLFRNKKFKGILRDIDVNYIKSDTLHYAHIKDNRYYFKSDTVMANTYIRYGDELRLESMPTNDINKLIKLLKKEKLYSENSTVAFFSWDTTYIQNYGKENIQNYYDRFTLH